MNKWHRNLSFKRQWHRTIRLEDGWKVRMDFWVTSYKKHYDADTDVSLIAYRGMWLGKWLWRKEGHAIGPGGLAIASAALQLLNEVETVALTKTKHKDVWLYVSGASLNLYLMYRKVLKKRGYTETWETPEEYGPYMIKQL